jgi:hypothetical protein
MNSSVQIQVIFFRTQLPSPENFFILNPEYDAILLEEFYILSKHVGNSIQDTKDLSTYERKQIIRILKEDVENQKKEMEKARKQSKK